MLRPLGAIVLGYLSVVVIVLCGDFALNQLFPSSYVHGQVPPVSLLVAGTVIFFAGSIFGGWLCARIAPSRVLNHIQWLFVLGELLGLIPTVANWDKGWPHWYSLAWLAVWPLALWIGMKLAPPKPVV